MTKAARQHSPGERAATKPDPELAATTNCAPELSYPHPTTLAKNVMQYSPSVHKTLQNFQHTKRTTTGPNRQPQKTYNTKRKRPNIAYNPTPDSEAAGDNTSPETQQYTANLKIPHASKRNKSSHSTSIITTILTQRTPMNNPPRKRTPKLYRHNKHRTLTHAHIQNI